MDSLHYILRSGKNPKIPYYVRSYLRYWTPQRWLAGRLPKLLDEGLRRQDIDRILDRVAYCNRLEPGAALPDEAPTLGDFRRRDHQSAYFFDSYEIVRWFDRSLRWSYLFGDVVHVPGIPSVVKSRPIAAPGGIANSVVLNLDKCRHFVFLKDRRPFRSKQDRAIFRGSVKDNAQRRLFVDRFAAHPRVDAADTFAGGDNPQQRGAQNLQPRISLYDHLDCKFIMALEGNDVASNLKWVMSSSSLAVMPRPTYETWFMEGRLRPDYHYVEVAPDFSDLEEKMEYYIARPAEAEAIVANANAYVAQFRDARRERLAGLLVMRKYFERTGQLPASGLF